MIEQLKANLSEFQPTLGFDPLGVEQGSAPWLSMRLGVITASQCKAMMAKKCSMARNKYMTQLIAEIATGNPSYIGMFKQLEWGNDNEPKAREAFSFVTGEAVHQLPFIYKDKGMRCGISPDGIYSTGLEIKCPYAPETHVDTLVNDAIKDEYFKQMQFSMYVTGADTWTFLSYDPRMPSHLMTKQIEVKRCEKTQALINAAVTDFISDMDKALAQLGLTFGQQWSGKATAEQASAPTFKANDF